MAVTIMINLDTRRMKKTNHYPVVLRVTYDRKPVRYQTIFELTAEDYDKLSATRISQDLQEVKSKLKEVQRDAESFADGLRPFSFYEFERDFVNQHKLLKKRKLEQPAGYFPTGDFDPAPFEKKFPILKEGTSDPNQISNAFILYIKDLLGQERIGSALNYQDTYFSLKKFRGNSAFQQITDKFLLQYENWMINRGRSKSTVGIKLRPLRAIFNFAAEEGIIKKDRCYPFGNRRYQIPASRNRKKALTQDIIHDIYYYVPKTEEERKALDCWFFCYFANGMNPKDMAYLRYRDIQDEYLVFIRAKTERKTRNDPKPITVYLNEDLLRIINTWGNRDRQPGNYIFPVLPKEGTALERHFQVKKFIKFINDQMAHIAEALHLDRKLTTIVTRHTFSTQMKRSGASTEFIQEALGHADKKTTENYMDSFENAVKKEFAEKLSLFKKAT